MLPERLRNNFWIIVFLVCIASRLFTTIFYLEDPDSLRFAFSIKDYDLTILQPHFPGYAVYCFLVKLLYWFSGNIAYSFSIIGGLAVFAIIYFSVKFSELLGIGINRLVLSALIFFNPFFWILSNRYMPDLSGLALLLACIYFLSDALKNKNPRSLLLYHLLSGLLAGVRLSFIPFLIIPSLYVFLVSPKKMLQGLLYMTGVLIWLVPMLLDTGSNNLITVAKLQSDGHFNEWGETIITKSFYWLRFEKMLETIWADGLGAYMINRGGLTILTTIGIVAGIILGLARIKKNFLKSDKTIYLIIISGIISYLLWIYFYQNVIYKARHIIPFLPFIIILISLGWSRFIEKSNYLGYVLMLVFTGSLAFVTHKLTEQHESKTAIAQASDFFIAENKKQKFVIYTTELMHEFFFRSGNTKAEFVEYGSDDNREIVENFRNGNKIYSTQNIDQLLGVKHKRTLQFYHNPYVNRAWPEIVIFEY